jgi:Multicopper oxidase
MVSAKLPQYLTVASLISDEQDAQYFVYPRETVRFHLLNMAADSWIHLWIENHTMTVIEVDGVYVEPYESQGVDIAIGQRYSVLVTMDANSSFNYPIVASLDPTAGSIRHGKSERHYIITRTCKFYIYVAEFGPSSRTHGTDDTSRERFTLSNGHSQL